MSQFYKQNNNENSTVIIDSKTGISGAGRSKNIDFNFSEISDNFSAYSLDGHRHQPEINYHLSRYLKNNEKESYVPQNIIFTPHLSPMIRGIFTTCYIISSKIKNIEIDKKNTTFTKWVKTSPNVKNVRGSNNCLIYSDQPISEKNKTKDDAKAYRMISVIDNLVKGAAGQAVHNMNLMYGFPEKMGLDNLAIYP